MMGISIIIISLAFLWLGYETKWLTVRLQRYTKRVFEGLEAVLAATPLLILIGFMVVAVTAGFFGINLSKKSRATWPRRRITKVKDKIIEFVIGVLFILYTWLIVRQVIKSIDSVLKVKTK